MTEGIIDGAFSEQIISSPEVFAPSVSSFLLKEDGFKLKTESSNFLTLE